MPEPLTSLEREILDYLIEYLRRNTYQPSIREIGRRFGIKSTKTVSEQLQSLADKGWIERDRSRSRGVKLLGLDLQGATVAVPCYGGMAVDGEPSAELGLDHRLAGSTGTCFLVMNGDSMESAGIHDGDLLLVEPAAEGELDNGDVVAAHYDGEALVKRYFRRGDEVVLEPANADYPPMLVRVPETFVLTGRVTAVFRRLRAPVTASAAPVAEGEGEGAVP